MTTEMRRQKADAIVREVRETMSKCNLHSACVLWVSPFDTVEYRVGYFPEYSECEQFANFLEKSYSNSGFDYVVYVDLRVK